MEHIHCPVLTGGGLTEHPESWPCSRLLCTYGHLPWASLGGCQPNSKGSCALALGSATAVLLSCEGEYFYYYYYFIRAFLLALVFGRKGVFLDMWEDGANHYICAEPFSRVVATRPQDPCIVLSFWSYTLCKSGAVTPAQAPRALLSALRV